MSETNQRLRSLLLTAATYLIVVASAFGFNVIRSRAVRNQPAPPAQPETPAPTVANSKPYFSLTTNPTYSTNETSRV